MDKLLKEAIADAKAVRETAIANAKLALEEAFTPKLQSMLSAKIREDEFDDEEVEVEDEVPTDDAPVDAAVGDEVPAEFETGDEGDVYSAGEEDAVAEPAPELEPELEPEVDTEDEMGDYEEDMHGGEEEELPEDEPAPDDMELEAIIRELENEMNEDEEGEEPAIDAEPELETEQSDTSKIGNGDNTFNVADGGDEEKAETETQSAALGSEDENTDKLSEAEGDEDEAPADDEEAAVDLEEIIKSLEEDQYTAGVDDTRAGDAIEHPEAENDPTVTEKVRSKLKEAYATIRFMRTKLQEVNLLNAKLLFANKLFRSNNLGNDQKLRVIETFDRAGTVREVKLVYSTLAESLRYDVKTTKRVKKITEGLASRPSRTTKPVSKPVISEGTVMANRFKKLAGLIK